MPVRVLLDACVLYPSSLRDLLLRLAKVGVCQIRWTDKILDEMVRAIARNSPDIDRTRLERLALTMQNAFPDALVTDWEPLESSMTNDHKDRHVLAAAVATKAQMVVTLNIKHFGPDACGKHGVIALTPDDFLQLIMVDNYECCHQIVESMAADTYRPKLTLDQVVYSLSKTVPKFCAWIQLSK